MPLFLHPSSALSLSLFLSSSYYHNRSNQDITREVQQQLKQDFITRIQQVHTLYTSARTLNISVHTLNNLVHTLQSIHFATISNLFRRRKEPGADTTIERAGDQLNDSSGWSCRRDGSESSRGDHAIMLVAWKTTQPSSIRIIDSYISIVKWNGHQIVLGDSDLVDW